MSIAIISSGGDCAGMNPAIKYFVEHTIFKGFSPYLVYDGLEGLIDDKIRPATFEDVGGIIHLGGTIIGSSRSKRFFDPLFRKQAYDNLSKRNIDKLIVLGGDGSFRAMDIFCREFGMRFVGIPSTIDNDIFGTDYCLGVDTALNMIRSSIDSIRDTASSFKRAFVVETMGRECGYLALVSAITSGAELCLIPEMPYDLAAKKKQILQEIQEGRRYIICVVAEGMDMTNELVYWFEEEIKIECRATILGHIQRGGNPSVFDRLMASQFVRKAIDRIYEDTTCKSVIVYKDSEFDFVDIDYVASQTYKISDELIDMYKRDY
jgi:6-phosphofructokinase 1